MALFGETDLIILVGSISDWSSVYCQKCDHVIDLVGTTLCCILLNKSIQSF